ncbi:hypothetical protein PMAYCL1PPCAC_02254 [Pristionchus mayeri]|uniref:STAS domain-containing protein n=1 Tax=Pristionchus mayeri TaxID=1317129 RepID=A0AAN5C7R9_9BILA|nr:hypothetical protein PMAYCL1PPCAC_02254 [Pristionchus mayeri]
MGTSPTDPPASAPPHTIVPIDSNEKASIESTGASTPTRDFEAVINGSALARPPMNQEQFDAQFAYKPEESEMERRLKKTGRRYIAPFTSCVSFKYALFGFIPILEWLPNYAFKSSIIDDVLGGLTVGVMHVPQGIAYAILANMPAVSGLYTSFLPPLVYTIFGTSRHNSIGSFAVVSLMCGMAVDRFTNPSNKDYMATVGKMDPLSRPSPEQVASSLTLLISFINFSMAILRLDFLTTYFSDQVVAGFTTAASLHVLVSQLKDALGIKHMAKHDGVFGLPLTLYELGKSITDVNLYACGISLFCIVFLLLGKEVISVQLKKRCNFKYTLPFELLLIIITTACSFFFHFDEDPFDVQIVGNITTGMPTPALPRFDIMYHLIPDALAITIVVYAVHISLAKMFAKKQNYDIDANQELIALGITSVASSFFPIYPVACSLGRTLLNFQVGTKTLLSNVFSSLLLLAIILFLGAYFEPLPKPVLSCIVIVALTGIFNKFADLRLLWPVSKIDFSIWVVSFLSTVFIDVTPGLAISICYALFTTIAREQWPRWHLLGNVHGTYDFKDSERYEDVFFFHAICIFRFDSPLLFTNVDRFKKCIAKAMSQWERSHEYYVFRVERTKVLTDAMEGGECKEEEVDEGEALSRHFIVDCSGFTFVDYMGVSALKEVYVEMRNRGVLVYFAAAKAPVRDLFSKCGFYDYVAKENFYPTIRDGVAIARLRQKARGQQDVQYSLEHDRLSEIMSSVPMH